MAQDPAKELLRGAGLRVTAPRLAVLRVLLEAAGPISHSEVLGHLGETDWDPATIYRNLVKLRESGLTRIVSRADGIDRYALTRGQEDDEHRHPHFVCQDCGRVSCLPAELTTSIVMEGPWADSVRQAMVQLRGECPDCRERAT